MGRRLYWIGLILVIIGIFTSTSLDWLRSVSRSAIVPTASVGDATRSTRGFFENLREVTSLQQRVADLEEENSALRSKVAKLTEVITQNERLETELQQTGQFSEADLVAARVVGRSPIKTLDALILDKGTDHGVAVHQPVLKGGFLVGVIVSSSAGTSTVELITNSRTTIPVTLQQSRGQGILRGGIEGLVVSDLPIDAQISEGEAVLTSALGDRLPADIPIGQVRGIISEESEILQRVTLSSPVKFTTIEAVLVVAQEQS